jgi:leucyl aminopeptidase
MFKSIQLAGKPAKNAVVILPVFSDELRLPARLDVRKDDRAALAAALKTPGFKGECGETALGAGSGRGEAHHLAFGLGKREEFTTEVVRNAAARLLKRLDRMAPRAAHVLVAGTVPPRKVGLEAAGRAFAEGLALANWRFEDFAGKASKKKDHHAPIAISSDDAHFDAGVEVGLDLADATNSARRLAATPPNVCTPMWVAGEAKKLARLTGLKCTVIDFNQAKRRGMGGLVNVGMGSANKPCMVVLEHNPRAVSRSRKPATLALVGKTVTYDTGGYSLKINNGMKGMKYDKCGGMAVLGAMNAIARAKLPVHVVGILPCAENMVSDNAYRPDDIITMYNGVTVEVTNTDAEGRLVLADALAYACKDVEATHIVELSTLTGGIVVALGHFCAGVFCNNDDLLARVNRAAEVSGEKVWRMPLWNEHKEFMRSQHADILNSNASRNAHPVQGAAFLAYFVDEKIPFAHVDIAGVNNVEKDTDLHVLGPTGYGVRMLVDLARSYAP